LNDDNFIKQINLKLERRHYMKKKKEKGEQPTSRKSERKPAKKITRQLKSKIKELGRSKTLLEIH